MRPRVIDRGVSPAIERPAQGAAARIVPKLAETSAVQPIGVGILGGTGYSGVELARLLEQHPAAELLGVASRQQAGARLSDAWPSLAGRTLVLDDDAIDPRQWIERGIEVVFSALPHGVFAARAAAYLEAGLRVVDLSADFRLRDAAEYERRYGMAHPAPALLGEAAYGLTEWWDGTQASIVANPGCYATSVLLATLPAVEAGWWSGAPIVANALSGVSGAGRAPSLGTHFVEVEGGASLYKVGEVHAHLGEMRQALADAWKSDATGTGADLPLLFNPHLVPMARGIVASIAIPLAEPRSVEEARALYRERYRGRPFVQVLDGDALPATRHVRGSNRCDLAVRTGVSGTVLLAYAALDNLVKGAAGQAIQNWNVLMGWPEATGLPVDGWAVG